MTLVCRTIVILLLAACGNNGMHTAQQLHPADDTVASAEYQATIRWTSYGIPHIRAADLGSLAFGQGYAFASLHACVLADQIVKVRGERSAYFGPGEDNANLDSDFGYLALDMMSRARTALAGTTAEMRALMDGYAAGYNKYLEDTGVDGLPPDCAGAEWVKPITAEDLTAYALALEATASSVYFVAAIGRAEPPAPGSSSVPAADESARASVLDAIAHPVQMASNGWAIGGERSHNGRGMLVANPHFPWEGELRFYEVHLTVPGDIDVYGATLLGLPLVTIGFNENLAWTHTFSSSRRFALYRLELESGQPTRYRYDGESRDLSAREYTVKVRAADGTLSEVSRTLYRSHHGPILHDPKLPWGEKHAFAIRDVAPSSALMQQYLAMNRAKNLQEFQAAFKTYQGTPFLNTMYADREGNAWYIDGSAVPDLPSMGMTAWKLAVRAIPELRQAWETFKLIILDGSRPMFELSQENSVRPGAVPYERAPQLASRNYVLNANDPYWLTNAEAPLTGYSPFYGEVEQAPSERTRMNHIAIREVAKFTVEGLQKQIMSDRALTAELLRGEVVERCHRAGARYQAACDVLAAWDGRYSVHSKGAILWREVLAGLPEDKWREPFDRARPIATPSGLMPAPKNAADPVVQALDGALDRLAQAKIPLDARLGDAQYTLRGERRFPVPGSHWREGSLNPSIWAPARLNSTLLPRMQRDQVINEDTNLTVSGYPVNYGSSFVMVVGFEDQGPRAQAVLTYSASSDPRSPHFADQLERYGNGDFWRPILYRENDIESDANLRVQEVRGAR